MDLNSEYYQTAFSKPTVTAEHPQRQLLIIDPNGTIVSRGKLKDMKVRPMPKNFLEFCFTNFEVMVWSSAQATSVSDMCHLFGEYRKRLKLIWSREDFGLASKQFYDDTELVKDLSRVWWTLKDFGPTNTILLDDYSAKSNLHPYNSIILKTFNHKEHAELLNGDGELAGVMKYLDKLRYQTNVANYIRYCKYESPWISHKE
ncbi:NLI interacting factor-like phosphatase-domain-containing protein, partial [Phycomyces blakesleeanus]